MKAKVDESGWDVFSLKIRVEEQLGMFFTAEVMVGY